MEVHLCVKTRLDQAFMLVTPNDKVEKIRKEILRQISLFCVGVTVIPVS